MCGREVRSAVSTVIAPVETVTPAVSSARVSIVKAAPCGYEQPFGGTSVRLASSFLSSTSMEPVPVAETRFPDVPVSTPSCFAGESCFNELGGVRFFGTEQAGFAFDNGHLAAEASHGLSEFDADGAAAEDNEGAGYAIPLEQLRCSQSKGTESKDRRLAAPQRGSP